MNTLAALLAALCSCMTSPSVARLFRGFPNFQMTQADEALPSRRAYQRPAGVTRLRLIAACLLL